MFVAIFVFCNFVNMQWALWETVGAITVTLLEQTASSSRTMPLNSPGGSTLQWDMGKFCRAWLHLFNLFSFGIL